jgi:hypothetical protein
VSSRSAIFSAGFSQPRVFRGRPLRRGRSHRARPGPTQPDRSSSAGTGAAARWCSRSSRTARRVRVAEVHLDARLLAEAPVRSKLVALGPGQRLGQVRREGAEPLGDRVDHPLGAVPMLEPRQEDEPGVRAATPSDNRNTARARPNTLAVYASDSNRREHSSCCFDQDPPTTIANNAGARTASFQARRCTDRRRPERSVRFLDAPPSMCQDCGSGTVTSSTDLTTRRSSRLTPRLILGNRGHGHPGGK